MAAAALSDERTVCARSSTPAEDRRPSSSAHAMGANGEYARSASLSGF